MCYQTLVLQAVVSCLISSSALLTSAAASLLARCRQQALAVSSLVEPTGILAMYRSPFAAIMWSVKFSGASASGLLDGYARFGPFLIG